MDLEALCKVNMPERKQVPLSLTCMWNLKQKTELRDTENRLVVASSRGWGSEKMADRSQKIQTFSYNRSKSWDYNV